MWLDWEATSLASLCPRIRGVPDLHRKGPIWLQNLRPKVEGQARSSTRVTVLVKIISKAASDGIAKRSRA